MPTIITPVDQWGPSDVVSAPSVGDPGDANAIKTALQTIENRFKRLSARVIGAVTGDTYSVQFGTPYNRVGTFKDTFDASFRFGIVSVASLATQRVWFNIPYVSGAKIKRVLVNVQGIGCTVLPSTMPSFSVYKYNFVDGTSVSISAGNVDPATTPAQFNSMHWILSDEFNVPFAGCRYFVEFNFGSGGTLSEYRLCHISADITG